MKHALAIITLLILPGFVLANERPNIVWIVVDDMSSHFGYQGETLVTTPRVDRLAKEGIVFSRAYATAPVCSTFRSAMITGMYQTTIGAHHHRSSRGAEKIYLPQGIRTIPELFRDAGYYTCISNADGTRNGKEDYNFVYNRDDLYDGIDWNGRDEGQPFFAQFQLHGGKHRNSEEGYEAIKAELDELVDRAAVTLPPYYPDHPVFREDWAAYLDSVNYTDIEVGRILARLKEDGVLDNTIVFFLTDHGISQARGKQFLYEEGVKIPFVVWSPELIPGGAVRDDLIAHIDLGAASLALAGIPIPDSMQGRPLFGSKASPRDYVVFARDRCDETVDRIRGIRKGSYKYIRNYYPERPYLQPCRYKDAKPFMPPLRELYAAGKLNAAQSLHLAETRPEEELYDLNADPFEIHNLADAPKQHQRLLEFRALLNHWEMESDDRGRFPELESMYDSDMDAAMAKNRKRKNHEAVAGLKTNIELMKKWASEGK
ncbi:MAG: sulfatase [Planctomycetaceae bacterium]|nr:sulfatase [Planctomycetaceae bacterium]